MVSLLRRANLLFVSHDLHAIFAQAAIHRRLSRDAFGSPFEKRIGDVLVSSEVVALQDFDPGMARRKIINRRVNPID